MKASGSSEMQMARIRDLYPHFEYTDLVKHPAIVLIPYQVSIMSYLCSFNGTIGSVAVEVSSDG
jgi:hypothetical protein